MLKKSGSVAFAFILLNGLWAMAAWLIDRPVLIGPLQTYAALPQLWQQQIGWHILFSLERLFWSLLLAGVLGSAIGLLIARVSWLASWLDPLIYLAYPIPKIALLPVIMLLFGLGNGSKIALITLIIIFQVILSVRDALAQVPPSRYQNLQLLGATRLELFIHVSGPASLAGVISAMRIALGTAIATLFFTEVYGTQFGLGYFIMDAWNRLDYPAMYGGIVVLSAVAFLLFAAITAIEHHVLRWQQS